mmetsp:Transcript_22602/g.52692  ORF Transcript_22602/g.52692 Transcript_22602/m.52692 type:complete len:416 (-) Transcript_22602:174-1421(-)
MQQPTIVFSLLLLLPSGLVVADEGPPALREQFEDYKLHFGKSYDSPAEEQMRYNLFLEALQRIEAGNKRNGAPVFGLTYMSDRLPEEGYKRGRKGHADTRFIDTTPVYEPALGTDGDSDEAWRLPKDIDWRLTRAVTAVKNQGQCGSCWAFSAAEEIESQFVLRVSDGHEIDFSPQQINSCTEASDGCGGGDTITAYDYLKHSPGLSSSFFWPYAQGLTPPEDCEEKACTQACKSHNLKELKKYEFYIGPSAQVTGFKYATPPCNKGKCHKQNLHRLASAVVNQGPVSVCVNAGAWSDYKGGVMTAAGCGSMAAEDLDHCVQLVGYNTTASPAYWIVRNSWAENWGESGYIYLEFNSNACGIANEATIATLEQQSHDESPFQRLQKQAMSSQQMEDTFFGSSSPSATSGGGTILA